MKKFISLSVATAILLILSGCANKDSRLDTRFIFDTVVKLDIECDEETLLEAFALCEKYDKLFSKTNPDSELCRINNSKGFVSCDEELLQLIERGLYFSRLSKGEFDITISPVCDLWDFEGTSLPDRNEIAEALKNVDYEAIEIKDNKINLNGKKIDLGGIAKGYIADKLQEFFLKNGVKNGIINLGGNLYTFGEKTTLGIANPNNPDEAVLRLEAKDLSLVTAGTYQRNMTVEGKTYHHILDTKTGFSADSDVVSATVIGKSSLDCDALSTICILLGQEKAIELINTQKDTEAVLILRDGSILYTNGIYLEADQILFKN